MDGPLPPIGRMDSAIRGDERGGLCVWEAEGVGPADTRAGGRVSLQSPLISLPPRCAPPPARRRLNGGQSRAGTRTERTGGRPGMRRRSLVDGVRLHTKTTRLQYYEQFHTVTK